ncbi:hypothetical protein LTR56_007385 [Elasticomyces elasticus]|nr:hypothetical protein LTR56_007385 [Elasticomyces elasticus]KAK3668074.1 hypothetical protein LTR22_001142 [Elasticomyces elasticus]KAK4925222.1 hypothetical protein LTR49_007760 [Elasticomyces elasticus]KAK5767714.1 hypothetical protein LTS12_002216 [Elasticomyces elasticus]
MSSDNNSTLSAQVKKLNVSDDTASETAPSELVAVVDDLLNQLSSKFGNLSSELIGKSSLEFRTIGRDVPTARQSGSHDPGRKRAGAR